MPLIRLFRSSPAQQEYPSLCIKSQSSLNRLTSKHIKTNETKALPPKLENDTGVKIHSSIYTQGQTQTSTSSTSPKGVQCQMEVITLSVNNCRRLWTKKIRSVALELPVGRGYHPPLEPCGSGLARLFHCSFEYVFFCFCVTDRRFLLWRRIFLVRSG